MIFRFSSYQPLSTPFFVFHKASPRKPEKKPSGKTRRRIELSPDKIEAHGVDGFEEQHYENLRMDAFQWVWSKIESSIKDVLRKINIVVFDEIDRWVHESFDAIHSCGTPDLAKATRSYPIVTDVISKQLFTGLIFCKNMEFVDNLVTFADLGMYLKSHGCHVANLSSLDFSAKNGIGGCLRSLLRQFLMVSIDAADITALASWYAEQGNHKAPVVVIIDDMERCCGSVLSDFILMLSEWVFKIPIILIMGVATTTDAPRNTLSSNALQYLSPTKFILRSPAERLDAIIEAVLVKQCSGFCLGHKVALFLRNCFLRQDGTLTSFIRALKMAIVQHLSTEPLSFILKGLVNEEEHQVSDTGKHASLSEMMLKRAFDLPSYKRYKLATPNGDTLVNGLSEMKKLQKLWSSLVLSLYEAGKCHNMTLLDLYCEALRPELYDSRGSDHHLGLEKHFRAPSSDQAVHGQRSSLHKGGVIHQAISKVRDIPASALGQLFETWEKLTEDVNEIHEKVKELQSLIKLEDGKCSKQEITDISKRHTARSNLMEKGTKALHEKAITMIGSMVRDYMQPIECISFHEIGCFKNVDKLQSALIGDPRRRIQVDLLESHKFLRCSCCSKSGNIMLPSMHDTSIMYALAQEHGDLINLHDCYQSFKAAICQANTNTKGKPRLKQSPSPKKRRVTNEPQTLTEASIQARFCRAVTELQVTGLLRMPTKRRPDYVQRVAFGL
ncbi:hypothetical protein LguiA_031661 [Lonicera macranthoides]